MCTVFLVAKAQEYDNPKSRAEYDERLVLPNGEKTIKGVDFWGINAEVEKRAKGIKNTVIKSAIPDVIWQEQGPYSIGGRCRTIMFDPNTTNKIWAGGAAGGLWYKANYLNNTSAWIKVNDFWENLVVTSIAYDPSNTQVFYAATGERAPGGGNARIGNGIYKSTDGGITWFQLPNTKPSTNDKFTYIQKIVVSGTGKLYSASFGGLMVSTDGGNSWYEIDTNYNLTYNNAQNYFDDVEIGPFNILYASYRNGNGGNSQILKISATDVVTNVTPCYGGVDVPCHSGIDGYRIEIAIAPSTVGNTQVIYAVCIDGTPAATSDILWFKKSINAGSSWSNITIPQYQRNGAGPFLSFTNGGSQSQGDYDLTLAVHPTNPDVVIAGGVTNTRSINGGTSWTTANYWSQVHPDLHTIVFNPANLDDVLIGNDGGVFLCSGYGNPSFLGIFSSRNYGFSVTEFYRTAIKNVANDTYTLAGAQDNGTIKMTDEFFSEGTDITSNDGMYCFIDQDQPTIQVVSIQNINHYLLNETTNALTPILNSSESKPFVNPCDYDSQNNIFYAYAKNYTENSIAKTKFYRISGIGGTRQTDSVVVNTNLSVTYIKVAKTANTLFIGTTGGSVWRLTLGTYDAANDYYPATATRISLGTNYVHGGIVHSIEIGATDNELISIQSAYNIVSIFYTANGGTTWVSKDNPTHGLPNIPIYDALFNPTDRRQVLVATELGVFSTMDITAANPLWEPTDAQLAHVRCMRFVHRTSDNTVALATHGRGVFRTKFNAPCPVNRNFVALPAGSAHYEASSIITATITMPTSATISFDAGQKVSLKSGFKVNQGTHFKAYIDGCGGVR